MLALMSVLTTIAVGAVLKLTASVFIPLVIAWFLLQISRPILLFGQRLNLPHVFNVLLVFSYLSNRYVDCAIVKA